MKKPLLLFVLISLFIPGIAQKLIQLPYEKSDAVEWTGEEEEFYYDKWGVKIATNVSVPTLQVFSPPSEIRNGTAVIVAPGGGFYAHSIESEGRQAARWLNEKGITAFVLKYRIIPVGEEGIEKTSEISTKHPLKWQEKVGKVLPLAIADGLSAVSYVRSNAEDFGIDPQKIGFMGFSAGGAVTLGAAYNYSKKNRPDFLAPVYPGLGDSAGKIPADDAPPMLIICATDDPFGLAPGCIELFRTWHDAGLSVGLHMYSKGGHGFGMRKLGLPSDTWMERFYEWSVAEGFTVPVD